jgi:hypothetical protein
MPPPSKRKKQLAIASAQAQLRRRLAKLAAEEQQGNDATDEKKNNTAAMIDSNRSESAIDTDDAQKDSLGASTRAGASSGPSLAKQSKGIRKKSRRKQAPVAAPTR